MKEHNPNWSQVSNYTYKRLTIGSPGFRKTNILLNSISHQSDVDKMCLHTKDPCEEKYQLLVKNMNNSTVTIPKTVLNTRILWMIFMKILINKIETKNTIYWLY